MSAENLAVAMAWFRREQWDLLRAVSVDADNLERSYDQWHSFALGQFRDFEAKGIRVRRIDVEVGALMRWCESEGRVIDGSARAEYAARGLGQQLSSVALDEG